MFSGLGGWSAAFRDRGHHVVTIDRDFRFNCTYTRDIGQLTSLSQFGEFDAILASPPCENFSIASVYIHWKGNQPDLKAQQSIALVNHTLQLIEMASPRFWIMENPRGMLRKVIGKPQAEISMCQYGTPYMKPTDLWGILPTGFEPKRCAPKRSPPAWWKTTEENANLCSHEVPPRGSKTGVQGIGSKKQSLIASQMRAPSLRALIPYGLSEAVCLAMEEERA